MAVLWNEQICLKKAKTNMPTGRNTTFPKYIGANFSGSTLFWAPRGRSPFVNWALKFIKAKKN